MKNVFSLSLIVTLFFFSACNDDPEGVIDEPPVSRKAIIGVEGIVPNGISSLGEYDIAGQILNNNVYRKANLTTLGSGLTDLHADEVNQRLLAVLPSSEKLAVCNLNNYELEQVISIDQGARKILSIEGGKYYLTTWETDEILVFGPNNFGVINTIDAGNNPNDMLLFEDLLFVNNTGNFDIDSTVTIIRTTADTVIATLQVGVNPNGMAIDHKNNVLYILSAGKANVQNPTLNGVGSLWKYNLDSMRTAIDSGNTIQFDTVLYFNDNQLKPQRLVINSEGGNLYYLSNAPTGDIITMSTMAKRVSEVPALNGNFYNLEFDEVATELYGLRTPTDIEGTGSVQIFSPDLSLKVSHKVGSKPREVEFK
jgi:hypothetical protein